MDESSAERWLPVPGYEGFYEVSDAGRVKSIPRPSTRGGILKGAVASGGYVVVVLWRYGQGKTARIHCLVMEAFVGPRPGGIDIRHLDGNPQNNALTNLAYGSRSENVADMIRHGRSAQANRTHCPQGHPYDEENTRWYRGMRYCLRCNLLMTWKKRGKEPDSPRRRPAPRTHCKKGHEFTPENTYVDPKGNRRCRTCQRASAAA